MPEANLLGRMPNPARRLHQRRRFRQPSMSRIAPQAGVLVVNQTGVNAEAVASHVLAMVLALSKQIVQTQPRLAARHDAGS